MSADRVWTEADFAEMSWHDNHVHGVELVEGEHGGGDFVLDVDYICEWICPTEGSYRFRIVPSHLRFRDVTRLRLALDYVTPSASHGPFVMFGIERREEHRERYVAVLWTIDVVWPQGETTFESPGFEQRAWGVEVLSEQQHLSASERRRASR